MTKINKIELHEFKFTVENLGNLTGANSVGAYGYSKGSKSELRKFAIRIVTDDNNIGEYVTHWCATDSTFAQACMLAPKLIGRHAEERESIYDDLKRELRQFDHMGHGPIDIALWDWFGKKHNCSVKDLLGGYKNKLPAYASTYHGDRNGGLDSKEAYVDFAEECYELGYRAFKVHGWNDGNVQEEVENILNLSKNVGHKMTLMLDPACELKTFADALLIGRACDEANYFWLEDSYRDGGVSAFGHKKLRNFIKTPILQTEHVRGLEPKADFVLAGGTDFLRMDPEYDMGITGGMKIAHLAEALGIDVEIHACGPAHRIMMSAIRNTNYYEVALVGPDCENAIPPVYKCGYNDMIDCIDSLGNVSVPNGIGLGVEYDWDYINKNLTNLVIFK